MNAFSREALFERASLRVVRHIIEVRQEKANRGSDTRFLEEPFLSDDLTLVGASQDDGSGWRREHVIPRKWLIDEIHRRLDDPEQSVEAVAKFIREHVKIVKITRNQCLRLDSKAGLGLKTNMPAGWKFGDDPYARLALAGIEWSPREP